VNECKAFENPCWPFIAQADRYEGFAFDGCEVWFSRLTSTFGKTHRMTQKLG